MELQQRLTLDFAHFGLRLSHLYITSITPPEEVQKAIDDRSRMEVFQDMEKLMKMKAAMALEQATPATARSQVSAVSSPARLAAVNGLSAQLAQADATELAPLIARQAEPATEQEKDAPWEPDRGPPVHEKFKGPSAGGNDEEHEARGIADQHEPLRRHHAGHLDDSVE